MLETIIRRKMDVYALSLFSNSLLFADAVDAARKASHRNDVS